MVLSFKHHLNPLIFDNNINNNNMSPKLKFWEMLQHYFLQTCHPANSILMVIFYGHFLELLLVLPVPKSKLGNCCGSTFYRL